MKKVYLTRHGQSMWNVENKICGATDIGLTERGHNQAQAAGKDIAAALRGEVLPLLPRNMKIDEILYSPLSRAAETARHISEQTGIPMRAEERLREQNFGKYEGTARNGAEFQAAKAEFINSYGGGESMMRLAQRIYNLLDDILNEPEEKNYLLVAHNGIARIVRSYFIDMTNEEFAAFGIRNCEVVEFCFPKKDSGNGKDFF